MKVNVNAVVFLTRGIGVGAVIRDDREYFVVALILQIPGAWKPCEAEAIRLKEALS